ncbi:MAG: hypothetical protein HOO94_04600 [Novosphingobium sp.]|nr:hypothetical protein [Novosphingobium sp.]
MVTVMQRKALLLDPVDIPDDVEDEIHILPSSEAISSFFEFDSYSGEELAFLEDGERLDLIVRFDREYKEIWGRKKFIPDFKYSEAVKTGDFSQSDRLVKMIFSFLIGRGYSVNRDSTIEDLVSILTSEIGIRE